MLEEPGLGMHSQFATLAQQGRSGDGRPEIELGLVMSWGSASIVTTTIPNPQSPGAYIQSSGLEPLCFVNIMA